MLTGGCLCGAVRYEITGRVSPIQLCALVPYVREELPFASIPTGSLDHDPGTPVFRQIFCDTKAPWFDLGGNRGVPRPSPPELRLPRN